MRLPLLLLLGCVDLRPAEDATDWFDPGSLLEVEERVVFTHQNYDFPQDDTDGIAAKAEQVFPAQMFHTVFGPSEHLPASTSCQWATDHDLPFEIEGVVTVRPRMYYKSRGCDGASEEKYYGSFFIQDRTGGVFVLGDSKVSHFDLGQRVRLRVRSVRTSFDLDIVHSHDLVEVVEREPQAIYYQWADGPLDFDDIGLVRRVEGVVVQPKDTFGEFVIASDEGVEHTISLDMELDRRGLDFPVGTRIQATGPVLYSYQVFAVVIMRKGQITVLDP